jgi:hypothetical protein
MSSTLTTRKRNAATLLDGLVIVEYDSGEKFTVRVFETMREGTDSSETDTVPSSTPSMAEAAASK